MGMNISIFLSENVFITYKSILTPEVKNSYD